MNILNKLRLIFLSEDKYVSQDHINQLVQVSLVGILRVLHPDLLIREHFLVSVQVDVVIGLQDVRFPVPSVKVVQARRHVSVHGQDPVEVYFEPIDLVRLYKPLFYSCHVLV